MIKPDKKTELIYPGQIGAAVIGSSNPRLPQYLPVYRLSTAETSCSTMDLAFSGVPK